MSQEMNDAQREQYMRRRREAAARLHNSSRRSYEQFRSGIRSGGILVDRLGESELITTFGATRNSLRRSLQMLARDGLVVRKRRIGTAVSGEILEFATVPFGVGAEAAREWNRRAGEDAGAPEGPMLEVRESSVTAVPTPSVLRDRLGTTDAEISVSEELVYYAGAPLYLRIGYREVGAEGSASSVGHLDVDETRSLEHLFAEVHGVAFGRATAAVDVVPCDPETAGRLGVEPGWPMLVREVIARDVDGRAREYSFTHFRGDRVALASVRGINERPLVD